MKGGSLGSMKFGQAQRRCSAICTLLHLRPRKVADAKSFFLEEEEEDDEEGAAAAMVVEALEVNGERNREDMERLQRAD